MVENNISHHPLIARLSTLPPDLIADCAIQWWQSIAAELTPIIGPDGFAVLYTRSLHLTQTKYSWLEIDPALRSTELHFALLKRNLQQQSAAEASEGCKVLFLTFTDILAGLIGESLTTGMLQAVWGDDASETNKAGSFDHE